MDKKIIVKVAAGLGNQMFMYANAFSLAKGLVISCLLIIHLVFFKLKTELLGELWIKFF